MSAIPHAHDLPQKEVKTLLLLASRSIFSRECVRETADSMTLLRPSYAAMLNFKSRCETAVEASILTVDAVHRLLCEVRSMFPTGLYPAMLSIRNLLATAEVESQSYASSLQCLMRELDGIGCAANANHLQSINAIQTLVATESSLVAQLIHMTTDVWVVASQHIAFLNEHVATLRVTNHRFDSDSTPVRTGLLFYEKKLARACDALTSVHELSGV